jgi:hypothetical protein
MISSEVMQAASRSHRNSRMKIFITVDKAKIKTENISEA